MALQAGRKHCGKRGEITRHEQFLLFLQCFQKTCTADYVKTRAYLGRVKQCNSSI